MSISFQCGSCGKGFRVKDELAGKRAKCSCGATVAIPKPSAAASAMRAAPQKVHAAAHVSPGAASVAQSAPADDDLFDEVMAEATKTCPSCKNTVKHDTVLCVQCGYNFRERKQQATEVTASPQPAKRMRCSKCGSHNARPVNDNEFEAFKDRKETAVAIGRPLICNDCGHMWEPPASLVNYFASYGKSVVVFAAGVLVTVITCAVLWTVLGGSVDADGEVAVHFSPRRLAALLRRSYPALGIVAFGLSLMGAGVWGVMRTLIVQMGWKGVLYDPDENKW